MKSFLNLGGVMAPAAPHDPGARYVLHHDAEKLLAVLRYYAAMEAAYRPWAKGMGVQEEEKATECLRELGITEEGA